MMNPVFNPSLVVGATGEPAGGEVVRLAKARRKEPGIPLLWSALDEFFLRPKRWHAGSAAATFAIGAVAGNRAATSSA